MLPVTESFRFDYFGSEIVYGRECISELDSYLAEHGFNDALVICGTNVGANEQLMEPLRDGLGDRLAGVFDGTTPAKTAETVYDGIDVMREVDPDVLVGIGGGSSLDTARQMSAFAADGRPLSYFKESARDGEAHPPEPDEPQTPVIVIPTTFAGADISNSGSIVFLTAEESPTGQPIRLRGPVDPTAMVYDPDLFETTPLAPLSRSAMNGFNKAVETVYAKRATPITDATAVHALRHLHTGFKHLKEDNPLAMEQAVVGMILAQFRRQVSIIHSFGHGFSARYPIQQGVVHAIVAPHVLRYVFENSSGRQELLAAGFDIDPATLDADELTDAIIHEVVAVRDSFDLPTQLRTIGAADREDIAALAEFILDDYLMENAPTDLDPTQEEIESVLREAW